MPKYDPFPKPATAQRPIGSNIRLILLLFRDGCQQLLIFDRRLQVVQH